MDEVALFCVVPYFKTCSKWIYLDVIFAWLEDFSMHSFFDRGRVKASRVSILAVSRNAVFFKNLIFFFYYTNLYYFKPYGLQLFPCQNIYLNHTRFDSFPVNIYIYRGGRRGVLKYSAL
jgi:hypothetical protein